MDRPEPDLNAFEARLAGWRPISSGMDRDRMLFLAGKSAARADLRVRILSGSAAALILTVVVMGSLLIREQGQRRAAELALIEATRPPTPPQIVPVPTLELPSASSYLVLTRRGGDFEDRDPAVAIRSTGASSAEPKSLRVSDRARLPEL